MRRLPRARGYPVTPGPANGHAFVALLIGGNEDVLRSLRGDLYDEFGIELRNQWQTSREFCPVPPRDTDVVLILTDFCAHGMSRDAVKLAKANKIRYALIGRKKSAWLNGLNTCGFIHKPSWLQPLPPARKEYGSMESTKPAPQNGVLPTKPFSALEGITLPTGALASREVPTGLRYIELPRRWTEADMQTVYKLCEAWKASTPNLTADTQRYVDDVWRATGAYRTPAVLRLRLDALRTVIKVPEGLLIGLGRIAATTHRAKAQYLKDEAEWLKGPRARWGEWISTEGALSFVGVRNRLKPMKAQLDRTLGLQVYRRNDFIPLLEAYEARGVTASFRGSGLTPLEWEQRILATLKDKGPGARAKFRISSGKDERGMQALRALAQSGAVVHEVFHGASYYRLPEHAWPPKPRVYRGRPRTVPIVTAAPAPAPVAAASVDTQRELRADVYRAMRAGEINAKDAAELLRQLAKGV